VTNLESEAFTGCSGLTHMNIPNQVQVIGEGAFGLCANLQAVFFEGNAPSVGALTFLQDPQVTAYYLPGTAGWDGFGALPTALWLPQIQTGDSSFGMHANQFGFNLNWASGQTLVVDACTDLNNPNWQPVQTNMLTTGSASFNDPDWTNHPNRFYRLRSP
jgi:hypothetical protein